MAKLKTKETQVSPNDFLETIDDNSRKADSHIVMEMMRQITGEEPKMWGVSMIGFGRYHYKYDSGHEGDSFITGFSPRKSALTLYIMPGFDRYDDLMSKLGKFKTGKSCLYLKKLEDVNMDVLKKLIQKSVEYMRQKYPTA